MEKEFNESSYKRINDEIEAKIDRGYIFVRTFKKSNCIIEKTYRHKTKIKTLDKLFMPVNQTGISELTNVLQNGQITRYRIILDKNEKGVKK
jgi:hypothetical protein